MSSSIVTYALTDGVAVVTMDDGKANALSQQMIDELVAALARGPRRRRTPSCWPAARSGSVPGSTCGS